MHIFFFIDMHWILSVRFAEKCFPLYKRAFLVQCSLPWFSILSEHFPMCYGKKEEGTYVYKLAAEFGLT